MSPFNKMVQMELPATAAQMEAWMGETRAHLLEYLTWCYHRSHVTSKRIAIERARKSEGDEWDRWVGLADVQTGEIYEDAQRTQMMSAMSVHHNVLMGLYEGDSYGDAQEFWEDFLYYQNPWNRRGTGADDEVYKGLTPPQLIQMMRKSAARPFQLWRLCLVSLYDFFRIGCREDVKGLVDAAHVHRYPEPVVRAQESNERRRQHLEEKFPPDLVPLDLDAQGITARRQEIRRGNQTKKNEPCPDAMDVDSCGSGEELEYYSAATASSWRDSTGNPVPTSWESSVEWGPVIGPVRRRCTTALPHGKPRYKVWETATHVRTFNWCHMRSADPREGGHLAQKSRLDGGFRGRYTSQIRFEKQWVLDEKDQRVPEENAPMNLTHDFSTPGAGRPVVYEVSAEDSVVQGDGRKEKAQWRKDNGLEDGDCRSDQPKTRGDDYEIGYDEDRDSDDGELFALSYRACVCACHHDENCNRNVYKGVEEPGHIGREDGRIENGEDDDIGGGNRGNGGDDGNDDKATGNEGNSEGGSSSSGDSGDEDGAGERSGSKTIKGKKTLDKPKNINRGEGGATALEDEDMTSPDGDTIQNPTSGFPEDDEPTDERTLVHQPHPNYVNETFRLHPTDPSLNICEYNPGWKKFPNFIQRNEVPAPKRNAKEDPNVTYTIVPKDASIPTSTAEGTRILDSVWRRDKAADPKVYPSGRYTCTIQVKSKGTTTSRTLEWIPQPILRLFRRDTGAYAGRYDSWRGIERMLANDALEKDDVLKFNKSMNQHYGRRDADTRAQIKAAGPWLNADNELLQRITDHAIQRHGLRDLLANQMKCHSKIVRAFNGAKKPTDAGYRTSESIRAKLNRDGFWVNVKAGLDELEKRCDGGEIKDADLRPGNRSFFVFKRKCENPERKKKGLIAQPRYGIAGKRKRGGSGEEGGDGDRNGYDDRDERDFEGDCGEDGDLGGDEGPPKKRVRC